MKRLTLGTVCCLFMASTLWAQSIKPAIFNFQDAFDAYYKTAEGMQQLEAARSQLQQQADGITQELQTLSQEIQTLMEEANNPAFSEDAQEAKRSLAEEKRQRGAERQQQMQGMQQAFQRQTILFRQEIIQDITDVSRSVASAHGANLLMDNSPNPNTGVPPLLAFDDSWDITEEVIAELNKDAPPEFTNAPAGGGAAGTASAP